MTLLSTDDTIVALATAAGPGCRGVVRCSGPATIALMRRVFSLAHGRWASVARHAQTLPGHVLLESPLGDIPGLLLLWPTTRSYTRQPAAELHVVGALPVLRAIERRLVQHGGRQAGPGEFTLRAFLAGRIDLAQAEAVLGVVDATDDTELESALRQLAGGLSGPFQQLRSLLLDLLSDLVAGLDFADHEIDLSGATELGARLDSMVTQLRQLQTQMTRRGTARTDCRIVLRGWPNTGKSSLCNALVGRDVALVSAADGTTRDYVRTPVSWNGMTGELIDTAGDSGAAPLDALAADARQLSHEVISAADIELFCMDATRPLNGSERAWLAQTPPRARVVVLTKIDRASTGRGNWPNAVRTSSRTGAGIEQLRQEICAHMRHQSERLAVQGVGATLQRCHGACVVAVAALERAVQLVRTGAGEELVAVELQAALDAIGQVVGVVYTDQVLDNVFARFCIGK